MAENTAEMQSVLRKLITVILSMFAALLIIIINDDDVKFCQQQKQQVVSSDGMATDSNRADDRLSSDTPASTSHSITAGNECLCIWTVVELYLSCYSFIDIV